MSELQALTIIIGLLSSILTLILSSLFQHWFSLLRDKRQEKSALEKDKQEKEILETQIRYEQYTFGVKEFMHRQALQKYIKLTNLIEENDKRQLATVIFILGLLLMLVVFAGWQPGHGGNVWEWLIRMMVVLTTGGVARLIFTDEKKRMISNQTGQLTTPYLAIATVR